MTVPPFDLSRQLEDLEPALDQTVLAVLHSGRYIGGEVIAQFEDAFAQFIGTAHAVGCNSGTDALVLALRALGIGPCHEVITTSFSFFATAEAISAVGATPVFVDVDPNTYLIDLDLVEAAIGPRTRAVVPVHLFGRPVDMVHCMAIARQHGLKVVEDCAQATGATWNNQPVGSWGDVGCFSFFPTKNLGAAGDAGCLTSNDATVARTARELAVHGMSERYRHTALGYNSRLDAIQAAVLTVKLPHLPRWVAARRHQAQAYSNALNGTPGLVLPDMDVAGHSWNQFVLRVTSCDHHGERCNRTCEASMDRREDDLPAAGCRNHLQHHLQRRDVNTIIYYPIPIHRQRAYRNLGYGPGSLPATEQLASEVLSLPMFPELTDGQRDQVVRSLRPPWLDG